MADLSKLRFNGTDYNVKDASAPKRKFDNTYAKTGNLPISSDDTTQTAIGKLENNIIPKSAKGTANGVAELDANGKVPSSQLPSYVDDVLEYSAKSSFPATGESGKIYVDTTTNKTYRWSGSAYVEISESLALGETDSTAYRGDRGKTAYDHSQRTSGNPHNVTKSDVGLGNVGNFKAVSTVASQVLSDIEKSNARANIGAGIGNGTYSKPSGGIPKSDLESSVKTSLDQVNANKTNILYVAEKTGKNLVNPELFITGGYISNSNGTVQPSETLSYMDFLEVEPNTEYYITPNQSNNRGAWYDSNKAFISGLSSYGAKTAPANAKYLRCTLYGSTYATTFMVCRKTDYDISSAYQPFSLPNSDLTHLEAEDRAELVELVDSGAKNVFQNSDGSDGANGTWDASTGTFTQTGTDGKANMDFRIKLYNGSTYVESLPTNYNTITANGRYGIEFTKTSAINKFRCGHNGQSNDCNMWIDASKLKNGTTYVVSINVTNCKQSNGAYTFNDVMICTKAAFGVSNKFVPYRPNYDLVGSMASALNSPALTVPAKHSYITSIKSGGYFRIGNIVIVNIVCTVGTALPLYQVLFTDLPTPVVSSSLAAGDGVAVLSTNKDCVLSLTKAGQIINYESAIESGGLEISGVYICS